MADPRDSISLVGKRVYNALRLVSVIIGITAGIVRIVTYFPQPEVVYSTKDLIAYPIPEHIRAKMLAVDQVKILRLMVQNEGERSMSGVLVRIPLSSDDGYISGWMTKSKDQSTSYMLGPKADHRLDQLAPGDIVDFYFYLKNVNSDLANRIEVFDDKGRQAAYYPYVPVRYVGSDGVIIAIERRWTYLLGTMLVIILLPSASPVRELRQAA